MFIHRRGSAVLLPLLCMLGITGCGVVYNGDVTVSLSPTSESWHKVDVGGTSGAKVITLTNTSSGRTATVSAITLSSGFLETATTCAATPFTLAAGASCTISVVFRPSSSGALTGSLSVADNAVGSPQSVTLSATGGVGNLLFAPVSLSFPGIAAGTTSQPQTATLTNEASNAITLASIAPTGHFTEGSNCPMSPNALGAGESCDVSVVYAPTGSASATAVVNVEDTYGDTTQLYLSGSSTGAAVAGALSFSPSTLTWGKVVVGTTASAKTVTVTNTQAAAVNFSSISAGPGYLISNSTCGSMLAAGASCTVSVAFRPTTAATDVTALTFVDDAADSPQAVALSGTGLLGSLLFAPTSLSFAGVSPGSASAAQAATLTNVQSTSIGLTSIAVGGRFAQTNDCPAMLAAGASCTFEVTSNPTATGNISGSVNVQDSTGGLTELYLTGTGGNTSSVLSFSPDPLEWGSIVVGQTSGAKTLTVKNGQTVPLTISSISVGQDFVQTATTCPTAPETVVAGASCTVSLAFRPLSAGAKDEAITFTDDAPGGVQPVMLTGTAVSGALLFAPTSLSFAAVAPGSTSAAQTAMLTNQLGTAVPISSVTVSGHFAQTNNCPASLGAGDSCSFTVTSEPLIDGSITGSVNVVNDSNVTTQLYLSGSGGTGSSSSAALSIAPTTITVPSLAIGQTSGAQAISVSNPSSAPISIVSTVLDSGWEEAANTCPLAPLSLAAGASCTISVAFRPEVTGANTSALVVTDGTSGKQQTVVLQGMASGASLLYSPGALSFGATAISQTSAPKTAELINQSSDALTLTSIRMSGEFSETDDCPKAPDTLASGEKCTINVAAAPTTTGSVSGTVSAEDSAGTIIQLPLAAVGISGGTGVPVALSGISFSPQGHTFGTTLIGNSTTPATFIITNTGSASVPMADLGVSSSDFSETNDCGASLAAGASCSAAVTFNPKAAGALNGTLSVTANGAVSSATLKGTGEIGTIKISPGSYAFGNVALGTSVGPKTITVTNQLASPLGVSGISVPAPFTETNNCPSGGIMPAGSSCAIQLSYTPTSVGYSSVQLKLADSSGNSPQAIIVTGNSYAPVSVTPIGGLTFGPEIIGRSSTPQVITVTNNQSVPVTISSITSSASAGWVLANNCLQSGQSSGTLGGGSSCDISVGFQPAKAIAYTGSVSVAYNAYGNASTLSLAGTGITGDTSARLVVTPQSACVLPEANQQMTAHVLNSTNTAVTWSVDGTLGGKSAAGFISSDGLYTAPSTTGAHTILAFNAAHKVSASTTISVTNTPSFSIYPFTASIMAGGEQSFSGQICSVPDSGPLRYSVDGIVGGNATVGTVNMEGIYQAPSTAGKHTIKVTDTALNETSGAVVNVYTGITADFGSRANQQYPIPAAMLGANHVDSLHNATDIGLLVDNGVNLSRTYAEIPEVYATQTPNWTAIDPQIKKLSDLGMHVLLQFAYTPAWLQPSTNPCGSSPTAAVPTNIQAWAELGAAYVAHMDATFPGVVTDYEIENEPDAGGLCGTSDKLDTYMSIYAATAQLMKQQAKADGASIRVGGPAVTSANMSWINRLLTGSSTAPYVDFVSYHNYMEGTSYAGATWDSYNGLPSLYQATQDPSGAAAAYAKVAAAVSAGDQPRGAQTPIYIDEYNTGWAAVQDCCRNNPAYAPVWNALYVTDLLDTVYAGAAAVPGQLTYFAANAYPYFCLLGTWDSAMDCQYSHGSTPVLYPQSYALGLLGSSNYLSLNSGGYMAASVTPMAGAGGLAATAFYTDRGDSLLIVNPTSTNYAQITVQLQNVGYASPAANFYQIVGGNEIETSMLPLSGSNGSYTTTVAVPAYTVVGISLRAQ